MILYLDTSALVKLFVQEAHSDRMREAVSEGQLIVTHAISFVEGCAAFARLAHARNDAKLLAELRRNLEVQWKAWDILSVTEALIRRAADLATRYRLRAYDSLHLAAAESAFEVFRDHVAFHFAVFDGQLRSAAKEEGIPVLEV